VNQAKKPMAGAKSSPVPAIERALMLLEFLAQSKSGFSTSEISRRLGLPKSSTYLIVETLEKRGFLQKNRQNGRYYLGLKLIALSRHAIENLDLREEAKPFLRSLMQETQLVVHMAVLDGAEAMLIDKMEALGTGRQTSFVGRRLDVHSTGVGKALVAYISEEELALIARQKGFPRRNDNTITTLAALRRELAQVRSLGYSLDNEEDEIGERCIGAPVFDRNSTVVAAISVAGTLNQIPDERIPDLANAVKRTAAQISSHLSSIGKRSTVQPAAGGSAGLYVDSVEGNGPSTHTP
jgi:DNA-binding IclR family transcriptional regulator